LTYVEAGLGGVVAAILTYVATFPIRRHAHALGLLDLPGERSSHRVATPRGGGIAIMLGTAAGLAVLSALSGRVGSEAWTLFGVAAAVGAVGLVDDRFGLSPVSKLVAQIAGAVVLVVAFGPVVDVAVPSPFDGAVARSLLAWGLSVLWLTTVVNFFNFMDGIDGLAAGQALASCIGIVAAAWSGDATVVTLSVGAACLGFLFHNAPRARIFMGDSGSGFLGFVLAAAPFAAPPPRRGEALLAVAIGLSLFLLDPIRTLIKRAYERKNIFRAHREHLYQELVAPDEPAGRVAATYSAAALLLALCGAAGYRWPPMFWVGGLAGAIAFLLVWQRARRASRTRSAAGPTGMPLHW